VHRQGVVMGFADTFFSLMVLYIVLSGLVLLMSKPDMTGGGGGGGH
jgi:DHA2 family multidrug resistance protein